MKFKEVLITYTQLKAIVSEMVGRDVPAPTLSRWMANLGYPRGVPGRKRKWNREDALFIGTYARRLALGDSAEEAKEFAIEKIEELRSLSHANY